jgi:hypothetical protein
VTMAIQTKIRAKRVSKSCRLRVKASAGVAARKRL